MYTNKNHDTAKVVNSNMFEFTLCPEWRLVKPQQQNKTQAEACTPTPENA